MNDDACRDADGWAARRWYDAVETFLAEHRLRRPGLDGPHITESIVALDCSCSAALTVTLPPRPPCS